MFLSKREIQEGKKLLAYIETLQVDKGKEMLESGVSPARKRSLFQSLESPLFVGIMTKSPALVRLLLSYGTPVEEVSKSGLTPLQLACALDQAEIVELLLEQGADVSFFSKEVYTADGSLFYRNPRIIKQLIDHGGNPTKLLQVHYFRLPPEVLSLLIEASDHVPEGALDVQEAWRKIKLTEQSGPANQSPPPDETGGG